MNRAAYLTTELAIKTLASILKASSRFHNQASIPAGPLIFVINHFTRLETVLLPYYLDHLTKKTIHSLADDGLFLGPLRAYFDRVGVVSTRDPQRDRLITRTLITSESNWIIFPEGRMVKNKKLVQGKNFVIGDGEGARSPHTGAASLALRAEIFRRMLRGGLGDSDSEGSVKQLRQRIGCAADERIDPESVKIVPVNLTYYPIRARDNFLSDLVIRYMKEPSERMIEELMAEGTMFLDGVDIDVRFGEPLDTADYMEHATVAALSHLPSDDSVFENNADLSVYLRDCSRSMMRIYMERIYTAATINHDHLLASLLRRRSTASFDRLDLARKTYCAALELQEAGADKVKLHPALEGNQLHLLSDDRHDRLGSFFEFGIDTGCLAEIDGKFKKHEPDWLQPAAFHQARISNPFEVMANEVEPLAALQKILNRVARTPDWLDRIAISRRLYKEDQQHYLNELQESGPPILDQELGRPFLLPSRSRKAGIVLAHSYLSVPGEVRELGTLLQKNGCWVYGIRLPGHGTTPEHLAERSLSEWRLALERGYALISSLCRQVFLVGFSASSMLMIEFASHLDRVDGIAAICPPFKLQDYSRRFMPSTDIWNRLVSRWKGSKSNQEFVDFTPENPDINYTRNPVAGVSQVGGLLDVSRKRLGHLTHPVLIVSADQDQVIGGGSSAHVYEGLGSRNKELMRFSSTRHNIITGDHSGIEARVREAICSFVTSNIE